MVIDDEIAIGNMLYRVLSSEHDITVETSSRAACARINRGERFDAIFCDVMMPESMGMHLYEWIRARAPDQAERIIFHDGRHFHARRRTVLGSKSKHLHRQAVRQSANPRATSADRAAVRGGTRRGAEAR